MAPHYLAHIKGLVPSFEISSGTVRPPLIVGRRWCEFLDALSALRPSRVVPAISKSTPSNSIPVLPAIHLDAHAGIITSTTLVHPAIATTMASSPTSTTLAHPTISTITAASQTSSTAVVSTFNPPPETTLSSLIPPNLSTYLAPSSPNPLEIVFFFALTVAIVFTLTILVIYFIKICKHCCSTTKATFMGRGEYERLLGDETEEEEEKGWLEMVRERMIGKKRRWEDWERHLECGERELSEEDVRLVWLRR